MKRTFVYLENFDKLWKSLHLGSAEQQELEIQLLTDPNKGDVITGTGGLRKLRFSPEKANIGKSGAYRIIYLDIPISQYIILLLVYPKSRQETLSQDQKNQLQNRVQELKRQYATREEE